MKTTILAVAAALSDHALLARVQSLAGKERDATVELVAHLAELDTRKAIYLAEGYGSLFAYCTAFVAASGKRCTERTFLEFHHIWARARGGPATPDNISLRCRRHNVYEAELEFGPYGSSRVRETAGAYVGLERGRSGTSPTPYLQRPRPD